MLASAMTRRRVPRRPFAALGQVLGKNIGRGGRERVVPVVWANRGEEAVQQPDSPAPTPAAGHLGMEQVGQTPLQHGGLRRPAGNVHRRAGENRANRSTARTARRLASRQSPDRLRQRADRSVSPSARAGECGQTVALGDLFIRGYAGARTPPGRDPTCPEPPASARAPPTAGKMWSRAVGLESRGVGGRALAAADAPSAQSSSEVTVHAVEDPHDLRDHERLDLDGPLAPALQARWILSFSWFRQRLRNRRCGGETGTNDLGIAVQ